jgi:NADH-quinone oxidoreductase subunit F
VTASAHSPALGAPALRGRVACVDLETTGGTAVHHRIIEVGCVEVVDRRLTRNNFHQDLQPDREIDAGAVEVHGITNEFLRDKPPFPANFGLYGRPTTINNTETYASVPAIIRNGAEWFLNLGKPNNGGPKIFSVSGHVAKPGNFEIRLGTPFKDLLEMAGGVRGGRKLKAVIPGGSSMPVLPGDVMLGLTMDYDSIQKAGSGLGSGAVVVMDETTCMVRACHRIARFYFKESCGQCTPCREGTGWMYRMLTRIVEHKATLDDLQMLKAAAGQIEGHTICAFGEAAAWPVQGFLRQFWSEFEYAIVNKRFLVDDQAAGVVTEKAA